MLEPIIIARLPDNITSPREIIQLACVETLSHKISLDLLGSLTSIFLRDRAREHSK